MAWTVAAPHGALGSNTCSRGHGCHTPPVGSADMARTRTIYRCSECGAVEPRWAGRCSACEAWNSLVEEVERPVVASRDDPLGGGPATPLPIADVDMEAWAPSASGIGELDRVLQGGLVPGSVTLLGG